MYVFPTFENSENGTLRQKRKINKMVHASLSGHAFMNFGFCLLARLSRVHSVLPHFE